MPVTSPIAQSPSPARRLRVDGDPVAVGLDADGLEPDAVDPRTATGRDEQAVTPQLGAVVDGPGRSRRRHAAPRFTPTPSTSSMPSRRRTSPSASPSGAGSLAEHALGDVDERHLAAEAAHGLGHLDADRTAAQDQQAAGDRGHRGHLAVRPHALELPEARNRRHERLRAGGHDDVPGGVPRAADLDRARPGEPAVAAEQVDAPVGQPLLGTGVRVVRDHEVTPGERRRDVDLRARRRLVCVVHGFARTQQGLGRDARPVGALATHELTFDHGDAQTALRQRTGAVLAGRAGTEDDDVVVGHVGRPPGIVAQLENRASPAPGQPQPTG